MYSTSTCSTNSYWKPPVIGDSIPTPTPPSMVEWYLAHFAIFENGHYAADQVCFYSMSPIPKNGEFGHARSKAFILKNHRDLNIYIQNSKLKLLRMFLMPQKWANLFWTGSKKNNVVEFLFIFNFKKNKRIHFSLLYTEKTYLKHLFYQF